MFGVNHATKGNLNKWRTTTPFGENIHKVLVLRCPSIQDFEDWTKCKERLDYLRRKYRDSLKNNNKTGRDPIKCPCFDKLDAVLGKIYQHF